MEFVGTFQRPFENSKEFDICLAKEPQRQKCPVMPDNYLNKIK
jgi:hypothetical protein